MTFKSEEHKIKTRIFSDYAKALDYARSVSLNREKDIKPFYIGNNRFIVYELQKKQYKK